MCDASVIDNIIGGILILMVAYWFLFHEDKK